MKTHSSCGSSQKTPRFVCFSSQSWISCISADHTAWLFWWFFQAFQAAIDVGSCQCRMKINRHKTKVDKSLLFLVKLFFQTCESAVEKHLQSLCLENKNPEEKQLANIVYHESKRWNVSVSGFKHLSVNQQQSNISNMWVCVYSQY